jgi:hypothetical protein
MATSNFKLMIIMYAEEMKFMAYDTSGANMWQK